MEREKCFLVSGTGRRKRVDIILSDPKFSAVDDANHRMGVETYPHSPVG
jgi:hypothetical protein